MPTSDPDDPRHLSPEESLRLQRLPGDRIAVISENDKYARYEIPLNDGTDFEILGRVIA